MATVMPVTLQTPEWPNLHAAEVRKLSTLLEISQALLAAHELRTGLTKVLEIIGAHHAAIRSTVVLLNPQSRRGRHRGLGRRDRRRARRSGIASARASPAK